MSESYTPTKQELERLPKDRFKFLPAIVTATGIDLVALGVSKHLQWDPLVLPLSCIAVYVVFVCTCAAVRYSDATDGIAKATEVLSENRSLGESLSECKRGRINVTEMHKKANSDLIDAVARGDAFENEVKAARLEENLEIKDLRTTRDELLITIESLSPAAANENVLRQLAGVQDQLDELRDEKAALGSQHQREVESMQCTASEQAAVLAEQHRRNIDSMQRTASKQQAVITTLEKTSKSQNSYLRDTTMAANDLHERLQGGVNGVLASELRGWIKAHKDVIPRRLANRPASEQLAYILEAASETMQPDAKKPQP